MHTCCETRVYYVRRFLITLYYMPSKNNKDLTTYYIPIVKYVYNFPRVKTTSSRLTILLHTHFD